MISFLCFCVEGCRAIRSCSGVQSCTAISCQSLEINTPSPEKGLSGKKKKVTVKILSLLSREQAKSWDVEEGEEEIGKVEKDGKGRFSRVLECAKATGKTPQDSQCLFEIKDSHKFSTLFS